LPTAPETKAHGVPVKRAFLKNGLSRPGRKEERTQFLLAMKAYRPYLTAGFDPRKGVTTAAQGSATAYRKNLFESLPTGPSIWFATAWLSARRKP
jgi:hypothetical protein